MRVLDLTTLYIDGGEGGVNTYLKEKASSLSRILSPDGEEIRHTIVVPGRRTETRSLRGSTLHTVRSPRVPGNTQHRVLVDFPAIGAILRKEEPDIIEVDCSYVLGHVAARAMRPRRVPIVGFYHVHLPMLCVRPVRNWIRRGLSRRTESIAWRYSAFCARPCDSVVVSTHDMYSRLEGNGFPRLEIVPLGVNLDLFQPRAGGVRPEVPGIDPGRPVILYVGRLSPEKDLEVLYAAHEELERDVGAQLIIAGDGPLRRQARKFARSTRGVVYMGVCSYGEELARLYRSADVLAVPGRNETFSLIVLEAFASGLPVVAVRQGGPSEICRPGTGELALPGDACDFAAKIRSVLRGRISGSACRSHVESAYSWDRTFHRLLALYGRLRGRAGEGRESGKRRALAQRA